MNKSRKLQIIQLLLNHIKNYCCVNKKTIITPETSVRRQTTFINNKRIHTELDCIAEE